MSFEGGLLGEYKQATSHASLHVNGMVSTTCVMAEWQLAQEEWVKTLDPHSGHRDTQRQRQPAAGLCTAERLALGLPSRSLSFLLPALVPAPLLLP